MKDFYTAVPSWHMVTCLLLDIPKFYRKCGFENLKSTTLETIIRDKIYIIKMGILHQWRNEIKLSNQTVGQLLFMSFYGHKVVFVS